MTPTVNQDESVKVAIRCNDCRRIVAYKLCTGSGRIQLKCPKCGTELQVDLSMRRAKYPIFYRKTAVPLNIPMI